MANQTVECERCDTQGPRGYEYAPFANVKELGWLVPVELTPRRREEGRPLLCPSCRALFSVVVEKFLARKAS